MNYIFLTLELLWTNADDGKINLPVVVAIVEAKGVNSGPFRSRNLL